MSATALFLNRIKDKPKIRGKWVTDPKMKRLWRMTVHQAEDQRSKRSPDQQMVRMVVQLCV